MELGHFSISLAVKDIQVSRAFYEKLGFSVLDGNEAENWLVLQNGKAVIGLFQDMFEENIITFNPPDVRAIQAALLAAGITLDQETDPNGDGPAHIAFSDPDGNAILMDQF